MNNSSIDSVGFVMPAYNEEEILEREIKEFLSFAGSLNFPYDLIVVENGSCDATPALLNSLSREFSEVIPIHLGHPNFGKALRRGLEVSPHEKNILVHVDHWDANFIKESLELLDEFPLVQGSKSLPGSTDERPFIRRMLTWFYNLALRVLFGFEGTDTTGLKAMDVNKMDSILRQCKLNGEMFETEIVLRCERKGLPVRELPVTIHEKRPQRDPLVSKILSNLIGLIRLTYELR